MNGPRVASENYVLHTMVGFAVAIALAPAVPNEIAPATDHDHDSPPLVLFRGGSAWEKPR
jgi:hypothetical protein